jgi:hypothetical protein
MEQSFSGDAAGGGTGDWQVGDSDALPGVLRLELLLDDAEVIAALAAYPEGRERSRIARTALKIGLLALHQAQGRIDADTLRHEGERLVSTLESRLEQAKEQIDQTLAGSLKSYFDPGDGRFTERVERLIRQDGDLERVMRSQAEKAAQLLTDTLARHVGEASPLMALLNPDDGNRFLAALRGNVEQTLGTQTGQVLREFSLDNPDGALARLLRELAEKHGTLTEALQGRIDEVVGEFSLDNADSALSRLVGRVESAQRTISAEFSLDAENSALARMRRELMGVLDAHKESATQFQQQVLGALEAMKARREASARSTTHGHEFEAEVYRFIAASATRAGDVAEAVGETSGAIPRSKVGDALITLGPDCAAAGSRIVVEAKEAANYTLRMTLDEIDLARRNREAQVGLFVHSRRTAPEGMEPIARYGDDIVVLWDAEDETSDAYLKAGLIVARAIAVRAKIEAAAQAHDIRAMEQAVAEIIRQAALLDDVGTWTNTIKSNAEKVLARVDKVRGQLVAQGESLQEQVGRLG